MRWFICEVFPRGLLFVMISLFILHLSILPRQVFYFLSIFFSPNSRPNGGGSSRPESPPCHHSTLRGNPPIIPFTSSLLNLILGFFFPSPMKQTATSITHSADTREEGLNEMRGGRKHRGCCSSSFPSFPPSSSFSSCTRTGGAIIWGTLWTFTPVVENPGLTVPCDLT